MKLLKVRRNQIAILHDAFLAGLSFPLALYLRLGDGMLSFTGAYLWPGTLALAVIYAAIQAAYRQYRDVWRYVSLHELIRLMQVVSVALLLFYALFFLITRLENVPRSVPFIQWMLLTGMLAAPRAFYRALHDRGIRKSPAPMEQIRVLLVGAGDHAEQFVRAMQRTPGALYQAVGMVDADPAKVRRVIHDVPVLGLITDIRHILKKLERKDKKPQRILITEDDVSPDTIQMILDAAEEKGVALARLPRLTDFQKEADSAIRLRPVDIEDVLGRPQQVHSRDGMRRLIHGKTILITGAGGSIGSELARQVAGFNPGKLILLDSSEYNLYRIATEMEERFAIARESVLMDIREKEAVRQLCREKKPHIVFHAAAIKHVPIAEDNIEETILTNVMGTGNVVESAEAAGAELFVLISTDKAVNPANVMGTTKRLAEGIALGGAGAMQRVAVRFGNVLGSTGSVVPLFQRQIAEGGPVTVTHPEMERYFMTIREAVELVIQSAVLAVEDDSARSKIYVLDMGKPIRIVNLARQMIRLSGLRPEKDIRIHFTGLRPGEKLFEELFYQNEALESTRHASIMKAAEASIPVLEAQAIQALIASALAREGKKSKDMLSALVPEYRPNPES